MTFTVSDAFELLFAPESGGARDATSRPGYESRRWFRRPAPSIEPGTAAPVAADIADADAILSGKILACIPEWSSRNRVTAMPPKSGATAHPEDGAVPGTSDASPDSIFLDPIRHVPPRIPYDVFAISAHLVEGAGIYHHLQPSKRTANAMVGSAGTARGGGMRHIEITRDDRDLVIAAANAWAELAPTVDAMADFATALTEEAVWSKLEPLFESWWVVFASAGDEEIFSRLSDDGGSTVPSWWKHAWRLFAIADEAAKGTAFQFNPTEMRDVVAGERTSIRWFEFDVMMEHIQRSLSQSEGATFDRTKQSKFFEFADITTLSAARQSIASVLPKVRTPAVGCTLRSLSHHLALLPPAGVARGRWTPNYFKPPIKGGSMPEGVMNLLLVHFRTRSMLARSKRR